jgi:heme oxygenase
LELAKLQMSDVRAFLATETHDLHTSLDRFASQFDLATKAGLEDFLRFMWIGCSRVEDGLDTAGAGRLLPEWPRRRRSALLARDLGETNETVPLAVDFASDGEVWGGLYVLEGSRLGGRILARSTPLSGQSAFLSESDERSFWPQFLKRLQSADQGTNARADMASGARKAFAAFPAA